MHRGLPPFFNGTADCIPGLAARSGRVCGTDWRIPACLSSPRLVCSTTYLKDFRVGHFLKTFPSSDFSMALTAVCSPARRFRRSWNFTRLALFNFYHMLDTISWDILYSTDRSAMSWKRPGGLCWLVRMRTGFVHLSDYTRQRFAMRFNGPSPFGPALCFLPPVSPG